MRVGVAGALSTTTGQWWSFGASHDAKHTWPGCRPPSLHAKGLRNAFAEPWSRPSPGVSLPVGMDPVVVPTLNSTAAVDATISSKSSVVCLMGTRIISRDTLRALEGMTLINIH